MNGPSESVDSAAVEGVIPVPEFSPVRLLRDFPAKGDHEEDLKAGDIGTVVHVFGNDELFLVEVLDEEGCLRGLPDVRREDLTPISRDEAMLDRTVRAVIQANPAVVAKYHEGQTGVAGFLIGEVYKSLRDVSPERVREAVTATLEKPAIAQTDISTPLEDQS